MSVESQDTDGSDSSIDPQPKPESEHDDRPEIRYRNLSSFQQTCLRLVATLDSPHGLAIKDELEDYYEQEVNHSRLYTNLDKVVTTGFVEKAAKDDRTNVYSLTDRGERVLRAETANEYETVFGDRPSDGGEP